MSAETGNGARDGSARILLLRDYTRTMEGRIASFRHRAASDVQGALDETLNELEVTREELAVANEEISAAEARFEDALRAFEARVRHYAELFDGAPDGYALTDAAGIVREGNRTLAAMLGVHKRFLEGKPLVNFVARSDVRVYRDHLRALGEGTADGAILELRLRPRNKEPVFGVEVKPHVVRSVDARVTSIRWSVRKTPASRTAPRAGDGETPAASEPEPEGSPSSGT